MKYIEKHPIIMIIVGVLGISLSAIFAGFLFGEVPTLLLLVGGAMVLSGVLYYSRIEIKK